MDEILEQLEASLGVSAGLLARAATARAGVSGTTAEAVVRGWGGEDVAASEPAPADPPPVAVAEAAPEPAAAVPPADAAAEEPAPAPAPEAVVAEEPTPEADEPTGEGPADGVLAGFPAWLAAALVVIPMVALAYVLIAPNGPGCGSSGQLAIDPETGLAENCDGTDYGTESTSFFAIGEALYSNDAAPPCSSCHGPDGGGGTGPAFVGGAVLVAFPEGSCAEHISWVALGTVRWPEPTYGANGTALGASGATMPGYEDALTPQELASVVIFERVEFGGQSLADAEADCRVDELELADG